jgi:endoglucanase
MKRRDLLVGAAAAALAACAPAVTQRAQSRVSEFPIRRGVNMGNALEATYEGQWGYRIEADHLSAIADAGFDGIRLPVRWHEYAEDDPEDRIDHDIFARVDEVISQALERGLKVQLNMHHFLPLMAHPRRHQPRVPILWRQIAEHYRDAPPTLIFELMNELNGPYWNARRTTALYDAAIAAIRESNPERLIVAGPPDWNSIDGLRGWTPPVDSNLALTVHFYRPHSFTHQDGEWLGDGAPHFGRAWGTPDDIEDAQDYIADAADWALARNLPMQLGEFGVNEAVPLAQRALWTRTVREACDARGIGWCVWDFAGTFPIYDLEREAFIPEMRVALGLGRGGLVGASP